MRVASQVIDAGGRHFTMQVAEPLHEFQESRERFEGILLLLAVPSLLLAALGGFWLSRRALSPVDRITNEARRISIANLSTRLRTPTAKDELQRLTLTLNEMLERIDTAVQHMVQFTADASHELRAPLALIHTAAEFSLRRERTREELHRRHAQDRARIQPYWRPLSTTCWCWRGPIPGATRLRLFRWISAHPPEARSNRR